MTRTPFADTVNYLGAASAGTGTPQTTAEVVVAVNPDGTAIGGTGTSSSQVQGNSASGSTDVGNPVKIGGVYNTTPPTLTNGQRGDVSLNINGAVLAATLGQPTTPGDGVTNTNISSSWAAAGTTVIAPRMISLVLNAQGTWDRVRVGPYQVSQTPLVAGSGNVANAAAAATLTGTATTTVYISGFEVTGAGATAGLPVTVTVTGLLGGARSYTYTFAVGATLPNQPLIVAFDPPLPASAVNTAIVVSCPASGVGGTNNTTVAHGFYQ